MKKGNLFSSAYALISSPVDALIDYMLRLEARRCFLKPIEELSILEAALEKEFVQTDNE